MDNPKEVNGLTIVLPPAGFVFCPYLPPIPEMSRVNGQLSKLTPLPCFGSQCALYASCQGELSPKAMVISKIKANVKAFEHGIFLAEKAKSLPMVGTLAGAVVEWLKARHAEESAKLTPTPSAHA